MKTQNDKAAATAAIENQIGEARAKLAAVLADHVAIVRDQGDMLATATAEAFAAQVTLTGAAASMYSIGADFVAGLFIDGEPAQDVITGEAKRAMLDWQRQFDQLIKLHNSAARDICKELAIPVKDRELFQLKTNRASLTAYQSFYKGAKRAAARKGYTFGLSDSVGFTLRKASTPATGKGGAKVENGGTGKSETRGSAPATGKGGEVETGYTPATLRESIAHDVNNAMATAKAAGFSDFEVNAQIAEILTSMAAEYATAARDAAKSLKGKAKAAATRRINKVAA